MAVKNLHLEHLEDEIINNGINGGRAAINFLQGLRDMMKGTSKKAVNMTVKWDGAPAIFCGKHPETSQFFVAKKSLFNKEPKFYTSEQQIKDAPELSGDLESKFLDSFKYLSALSFSDILQGDLMFTDDKSTKTIDGKQYITFQPNTILYAVDEDSTLGKEISSAKLGIVFHTTYTGDSIENLSASFGANTSKLGHSKDVWIDDASYKDVSGKGSMTATETLKLTQTLTMTGKQFHQIKRPMLEKFMKVQDTINAKGAAGASFKTYCNSLIRQGKFTPTYAGYMKHFENYWRDKVVGKVKMEKTKQIKKEIGEQLYNELRSMKKFIEALTSFMLHLVVAKQLIIVALNRVKSIGTFVKTATGFSAVNPEGYVAIDNDGKAVKLVDRMEFSLNNFTVAKNWDK
jgi:hypothetical protein|tara:strand:+ start:1775 stop:2980 length:1206 start_codon:yes stop_codon:yes gene_type:complete